MPNSGGCMNNCIFKFYLFLLYIFLVESSIFATEGYYKDLFMDGGPGLNSRMNLPAADALGLEYEYLADEDSLVCYINLISNIKDDNGFLLYPDGSPRFKMIYTNGGNADIHGAVLGELGRARIREFYQKGGSYTGTCAGAILATINTNTWLDPDTNKNYYNIWPGRAHFTQLADSYTDIKIPAGSPFHNYYDFGSDSSVEQVLHNGGVFVKESDSYYWTPNTELLATYKGPIAGNDSVYLDFIDYGSTWAYKESDEIGRIVITGSHPESVNFGEQLNFMKSIIQYALDGAGKPSAKGILSKGVPRVMNDNSKVGFEKIGDRQYHHFVIDLKKDEPLMAIHLEGAQGVDFNLFINKDTLAFKNEALFSDTSTGAKKTIYIENATAGTWYVSVKCASTVIAKQHSWGYTYEGNMDLMNGISYSILFDDQTSSVVTNLSYQNTNPPISFLQSQRVIEIKESLGRNFTLALFDLSGKKVWHYKKNAESSIGRSQIKIGENFGRGFYIMRYLDSRINYSQKVILQD